MTSKGASSIANPEPSKAVKNTTADKNERSERKTPPKDEPSCSSSEKEGPKQEARPSENETYQAPPETYNGGECDIFSWSQTITDIDLRVQVSRRFHSYM